MIVKFHARGKGGGSGPVDYLLGKDRERKDAKLLRGNADVVATIIDSSPYAKKYTSGVLSFLEEDLPQEDKDKIMSSFERALFAGLDADQYTCLWVEHRDKGRLELNFVIPNIELQTGKRLQPYFDRADQPRINAWKICANAHFQLHDPDDPINKRELVTPRDLPKRKQEASQAITTGLLHLANSGQIKSRGDVIDALEKTGFSIARTTKKSISIADPDGGQNIRLKGRLYEQDFRFSTELRGEIEAASQQYRADTERRVQEARSVYKTGITIKREENQRRYPRPEITLEKNHSKELDVTPRYSREHSNRCLGRSMDTRTYDHKELGVNQPTERDIIEIGEKRQQTEPQPMLKPSLCPDAQQGTSHLHRQQRQRVHDTQGILSDDDRIRNSLIERLQSIGTTIQRATRSFTDCTKQLAKDVRDYFTGKQPLATASAELERTGTVLEQQNTTVDRVVQQEQTLTRQRNRQLNRERGGPEISM